jgi:alkylation response protein AidB-like acyl-CoA dehydrogenase
MSAAVSVDTSAGPDQIVDDKLAELLERFPPDRTAPTAFLAAQFDAGLAWVHFEVDLGGLGLNRSLQDRISERVLRAGAPDPFWLNGIGIGMAGPALHTHGTRAQKERHLRPMFTAEEVWCQLFSEPGAGSDVAGLSTRAVRHGDEWIIDGQKVWTSVAHLATWGLLIARTDANREKHQGLTAFVVDMRSPGVEVRPLRQMSGDAQFNEVYFTGVVIPDSNRLGEIGGGWAVALTTLMNERVSIGKMAGLIRDRMAQCTDLHRGLAASGAVSAAWRDRVMQLWVRSEVTRLTIIRSAEALTRGTPGPEGSTSKLAWAELNQEVCELGVDLLGAGGMLYGGYGAMVDGAADPGVAAQPGYTFLRSRANSIEGGTSEVMRNILGERVLGLPPDVRIDKGRPWTEVPRS